MKTSFFERKRFRTHLFVILTTTTLYRKIQNIFINYISKNFPNRHWQREARKIIALKIFGWPVRFIRNFINHMMKLFRSQSAVGVYAMCVFHAFRLPMLMFYAGGIGLALAHCDYSSDLAPNSSNWLLTNEKLEFLLCLLASPMLLCGFIIRYTDRLALTIFFTNSIFCSSHDVSFAHFNAHEKFETDFRDYFFPYLVT